MSRFDQWVASNTGAWRDMDGAYGAQCWDLFAAYCMDLMGAQVWQCTTGRSGRYAGYAGSLYDCYPATGWQGRHFERVPASRPGLKGDVIIWDGDAHHPVSHVAILLKDTQPGENPYVLAQNAGPTQNARRMWEHPTTYGYLRPRDRSFITGKNTSQENNMQCIIQPNGEGRLVYFDGTKCHNLTDPDQVAALNEVARQTLGHDLPAFRLGSKQAPYYTRLLQAVGQA